MKVQDILISKEKWTKGALARTLDDSIIEVHEPNAAKFCLVGAIRKAYVYPDEYSRICQIICAKWGFADMHSVLVWNDKTTTTFQDVRELIERLNI